MSGQKLQRHHFRNTPSSSPLCCEATSHCPRNASALDRSCYRAESAHAVPNEHMPSSLADSNTQYTAPRALVTPSTQSQDDQKRKVEALVLMHTQRVPSAMTCVNVLFSDRYRPLDNLKLLFLVSVLRHKYESPMFTERWENVKAKLNTRCRGKRRTVLSRLQKQINFWSVYLLILVKDRLLTFFHCVQIVEALPVVQ